MASRALFSLLCIMLFFSAAYAIYPFGPYPSAGSQPEEVAARILDYGLVCFGPQMPNCALRLGSGPLLSINFPGGVTINILYIALVDFLFLAVIYFRKVKFFIALCAVTMYLFAF